MESLKAFHTLLWAGLSSPDFADTVLRATVGTFSAISGGNKLFVASRHRALCATLARLGIPRCGGVMEWWVPGWTFVAGLMLAAGLLTAFSAGVLFIIYGVAFACEARHKVEAYRPINHCDRVADYLYLPETLYMVMLVAVMLAGPSRYSLDFLLWGAA